MKTVAYAIFAAFILAGCNTLPTEATEQGSISRTVKKADGSTETTSNKSDYAAYLDKVGESKPLFELSCPATGCIIGTLKVNAQGDSSKVAAPAAVESAGVVFAKGFTGLLSNIVDKAAGAVPFVAGWKVLDKAFDAASGKSSVYTTTTNTDSSNRSVVNDSSNRSTNTDNSNRSVNNSNNRNCQTGAPTGTTGQTGSSGPATC